MQPPEVFVIAPFDRELQPVVEAVRRAALEAGFTVARFDQMRPGALFTSFILDRIRQADLIIADVSRQNSNVMYELEFAHALRKPTILLLNTKSDDSELPADLAGFQYFLYDPANLRQLTERVRSEIKEVTMQRSVIVGRDALLRRDALPAGAELLLPLLQTLPRREIPHARRARGQ